MIYGIDVHPQFQAGLNIEQVRAEGFDFIACKVSEATATYDSLDWLHRAKACGLLALGYHYLRAGNETAQADTFASQLNAAGVPGMLDAEALAADGKTPTLTVAGIRRFLAACSAHGVHVPLLYLPRWYWASLGSPDLSGLPALWASSYVNGAGDASTLYEAVTPRYWQAYGNLPVTVLQFTDRAHVAGQTLDADVFLGTREQFATLISGSPSPQKVKSTVLIPIPMNGQGNVRFPFPVGSASMIVARAWLSINVNGPRTDDEKTNWRPGHFDVYFQDDDSGVDEVHWDIDFDIPSGRSQRKWVEIPNGTTQINIEHNVVGSAAVTPEVLPK